MKSIAYPYTYSNVNGVWIMRDGVGDKPRRTPRKNEVVATGLSAAEVLERISGERLGRHFISHMHDLDTDPSAIRAHYKANGYRVLLSEEFFVHDSDEIPELTCYPQVARVSTIDQSDLIRKQRRNKKAVRDIDLESETPEHRLYAVLDDKQAYGWVGSVPFGESSWIADLCVLPRFRGRGYGSALMCEATRDDRRHGVRDSVLLASSAGARLYPHIGYTHIGTLQLFCPKRS